MKLAHRSRVMRLVPDLPIALFLKIGRVAVY